MPVKIRIDPKAHCTCWTGSKSAYFDSIADALRRLMWLTERTVSRQLLREHLKQNPPRH